MMPADVAGLVSVVIPTFEDDPEHLRQSVTSALQQSDQPSRSWWWTTNPVHR